MFTIEDMATIARKLEMDIKEGKKHTNARLYVRDRPVVATCWPHGKRNKDIPIGTAIKIIKHQFHLDSKEQGVALKDCTMSRQDYLQHLNHRINNE